MFVDSWTNQSLQVILLSPWWVWGNDPGNLILNSGRNSQQFVMSGVVWSPAGRRAMVPFPSLSRFSSWHQGNLKQKGTTEGDQNNRGHTSANLSVFEVASNATCNRHSEKSPTSPYNKVLPMLTDSALLQEPLQRKTPGPSIPSMNVTCWPWVSLLTSTNICLHPIVRLWHLLLTSPQVPLSSLYSQGTEQDTLSNILINGKLRFCT